MRAKNLRDHNMECVNYKGYSVYKNGSIKSNGERKVFLKGYSTTKGYAGIKINGVSTTIHRVVAECFIGKMPDGFTVNHKDGDKFNNDVSNLEYLSREDNYKHALDNNLKRNLGYYITEDEASDLVEYYNNTNTSMREIASWFGFDGGVIGRLIKGEYTYNFKIPQNA
tara:strand:+ start:55 stop:558 length:504 start_codon:yes stop_codon:yes gene_type:complete